jgi:SAM-dependent methyltransferase
MEPVAGAHTFEVPGEAYDAYMGRYAHPLASEFASFAGVSAGQTALDVGCGPGALTGELVSRLGASAVAACDPSASFVEACRRRNPGVDVRPGTAERLPFGDDEFTVVLAQLVLNFVSDPSDAATQLRRVTRPGGTIAACVWDFAGGMQLLRAFWDAARSLDPGAPDEQYTMRFGEPGEIAGLFVEAGLADVTESTLTVSSLYRDFDELWSGCLSGTGPVGSYCVSLSAPAQDALREALRERLGAPVGPFSLHAVARAARGTVMDGQ